MAKRILLLFLLAAAAWAQSSYYADAIIPYMPDGCGWTSTIILMNPNQNSVTFGANFWAQDGQPRTLPFNSVGGSDSSTNLPLGKSLWNTSTLKTIKLAAGAQFRLTTTGTCDTIKGTQTGWAEVNSSDALAGYVIMNFQSTDGTFSNTTLPFSSRFSNHFLVPFDNTLSPPPDFALGSNNSPSSLPDPDFGSAIVLVNPSFHDPATVNFTFNIDKPDGSSSQCTSKGPGSLAEDLKSGWQQAIVISSSNFPSSSQPNTNCMVDNAKGTIEITTVASGTTQRALELSGFTLRYVKSSPFITALISFPAQTLVGQ